MLPLTSNLYPTVTTKLNLCAYSTETTKCNQMLSHRYLGYTYLNVTLYLDTYIPMYPTYRELCEFIFCILYFVLYLLFYIICANVTQPNKNDQNFRYVIK